MTLHFPVTSGMTLFHMRFPYFVDLLWLMFTKVMDFSLYTVEMSIFRGYVGLVLEGGLIKTRYLQTNRAVRPRGLENSVNF